MSRPRDPFLFWLLVGVALLLALPNLAGLFVFSPHPGARYTGFEFNTDDQMVYAAWMRQAMHGRFFFDNRFTVDPQPGLTVHLYYWALGGLARLVGIPAAANLARIGFGVLATALLHRLAGRLFAGRNQARLAVVFALVGGGAGFLLWRDFGTTLAGGATAPIDVWQPEAFVFPSLLTNSLFAFSLCLILGVLLCVLSAQAPDWRPVALGACLFGVLMNVHSYDALLLALVLLGFFAATWGSGGFAWGWVGRVALIGAGAAPAAAWFVHVLGADPVFASRAATPTYSAPPTAIGLGLLWLLALAIACLAVRGPRRLLVEGLAGGAILVAGLFVEASFRDSGAAAWAVWLGMLAVALRLAYRLRRSQPTRDLVLAWAILGVVAVAVPEPFQRKLAMGMAIPWALVAGGFAATRLSRLDRRTGAYACALALLVCGASSARWLARELLLIRDDVAETTMQPVYTTPGERAIVAYLDALPPAHTVVVAIPGVASPRVEGGEIVGYDTPAVPDLNPFLSGLAGVYTYAGHWSETPDYDERRTESVERLFGPDASPEMRRAFMDECEADYVVTVVPGALPALDAANLEGYGQVVVRGSEFELIKVRRS